MSQTQYDAKVKFFDIMNVWCRESQTSQRRKAALYYQIWFKIWLPVNQHRSLWCTHIEKPLLNYKIQHTVKIKSGYLKDGNLTFFSLKPFTILTMNAALGDLVALDIPCTYPLQVSFDFPKTILMFTGNSQSFHKLRNKVK